MHFKKYVRKNDFLKRSQRNCVFQLWLMTEPSEVLADFASAFGNVNNAKISDLLEFLIMLLFSSLCFHSISLAESCKIMKTSMGEIHF